jgi:2,4-dienoyl-CoA reductase (NADPH2)
MFPFAAGAPEDMSPVAPSPLKFKFGVVPHELTIDEIQHLVNQFVEAAARVQKAGYDCVQIHGSHGYLIGSFFSPYSNKRTDKYGGSLENNVRFACEIIQGIKERCGKDYPLLIKISAVDLVEADEQMTVEYFKTIVPLLEKAGVDEIHVTGGQNESPVDYCVAPYWMPKALFADDAAAIKSAVSIPVGVINRIDTPELAEEILEQGKADLIWMLRPLVADPELPNKALAGKTDEINTCIACNVCIDILANGFIHETRCAVNPDAWREGVAHIEPSLRTKKVLVVGAGPAGMEAARIAAQIGHDVTLWEKDTQLGGQLNLAAVPPLKGEIKSLIRYFAVQLKNEGVRVELGKEATRASVKEFAPDVLIIAAGSSTFFPPIPGIESASVADARSVLAGSTKAGEQVVIIGGGEVGLETAELLAQEGKRVTVVELLPTVGERMVKDGFAYVNAQLAKRGVEILTSTQVEKINEKSVEVVTGEGAKRSLPADTVIIAAGAKPNKKVQEELQGLAREVYLAGDCLVPCDIRMSIHQGNGIGRMLY